MKIKEPPKMCVCGHPFGAHREEASTSRPNGPTTHRACGLCRCWGPREKAK
jgi:hypothetical protein